MASPRSPRDTLEIDEGWDDVDPPADETPSRPAEAAPIADAMEVVSVVATAPNRNPEERRAAKAAKTAKKSARRAARQSERRAREQNNNRAAQKALATRTKRTTDRAEQPLGESSRSVAEPRKTKEGRLRSGERGAQGGGRAVKIARTLRSPLVVALVAVVVAVGLFFWMRAM